MNTNKLRVTVAAAALAGVTLAGCTSGKSGSTTAPTAQASSSVPNAATAVTGATNIPVSVPNDPSKRKNATLTSCAAIPGGWQARGTVHNPGSQTEKYNLSIDFTSPHFTDLGANSTVVSVEPGKTVNWSVEAKFKSVEGTKCILRGVATV